PMLAPQSSTELRERLLAQLAALRDGAELLAWAKVSLPLKNTLVEADVRAVEAAYHTRLGEAVLPAVDVAEPEPASPPPQDRAAAPLPPDLDASPTGADLTRQGSPDAGLAFPKDPLRKRSKVHLAFVRGQPCLVCKQTPSDAHHLKFAQPRALGRKVSDEFTVPLCRSHHLALHRHGNERAWWADMQIAPLPVANELWAASSVHEIPNAAPLNGAQTSTL